MLQWCCKVRKIFIIFTLIGLSGCSTLGLYQWGGYEEELHRYYAKPESRETIVARLESHSQRLESAGKLVPPGFYAELGTFYLEFGDEQRAVEFYTKEAELWPESRAFMNLLINNLAKRSVKKEASDAL